MIEVITGKQKKKVRAVIYGPEGIGKSTMASQFPKPIFFDIEGGTHALDVARVQTPKSWAGLM
jgi:replication-associated recombination protein RarA